MTRDNGINSSGSSFGQRGKLPPAPDFNRPKKFESIKTIIQFLFFTNQW